ncbi:AVT3B [Symbiodinium natans]|uniref:AVT3B protein n=1 Tax=Symbiodinium natans TaxID=878477 RepID=A0A812QQG7_9DINO|nr:AVT3B [Symbiodinium natans]
MQAPLLDAGGSEDPGIHAVLTVGPRRVDVANALYNMICFTVGAGMLGLPHALLFARELFIVPVVLGGFLCYYTAEVLHRVQVHHGACSYEAIGAMCGPAWLPLFIRVTLAANQLGIAILYIITICKNLELLWGADPHAEPRWQFFAVVAAITFLPLSCGGRMSGLVSFMSLVGVVSVLAVGLLVVWAAQPRETDAGCVCASVSMPQMLSGMGTAIFAYGGHPVYPSVQGSMHVQGDFDLVLKGAFFLMILLFVLVLHSSWRAFGCSVHGYVLDDLDDNIWRSAAVIGITLHLVAALPVVLIPALHAMESAEECCALRFAVVTLVTMLAFMLPFFTDFVALIGGLTENALVFLLPLVFHHCTFSHSGVRTAAFHISIALLALAILWLGTVASLDDISHRLAGYHVRWSL